MKNIMIILAIATMSIANADECVSIDQMNVAQDSTGYSVTVPLGYGVLGVDIPTDRIIHTDFKPINLDMVMIFFTPDPSNPISDPVVSQNGYILNITPRSDIECLYGNGSVDNYRGIILTKIGSNKNIYDLSAGYSVKPDHELSCLTSSSACTFTPHQ